MPSGKGTASIKQGDPQSTARNHGQRPQTSNITPPNLILESICSPPHALTCPVSYLPFCFGTSNTPTVSSTLPSGRFLGGRHTEKKHMRLTRWTSREESEHLFKIQIQLSGYCPVTSLAASLLPLIDSILSPKRRPCRMKPTI